MFSSDNKTVSPEKCTLESPGSRHFCQLHHDKASLAVAIGRFTRAGLLNGEIVSLITPPERERHVRTWLQQHDIDPQSAVASGKLTFTTPAEMRAQFMPDGALDMEAFKKSFCSLLDGVQAGRQLRLYGELSNSLWHEGDIQTAITLDHVCDELVADRDVSIFCGYLLDGLAENSYQPGVESLCQVHDCLLETPEDIRLREAVDTATQEVLGIPLSVALNRSPKGEGAWWDKLPLARRTIAWLHLNMPAAMLRIIDRARQLYA